MNICLIQTDPTMKENIQAACHIIQTTEADLYLLPELFTTGFDACRVNGPISPETIPDGPTVLYIQRLLKGRTSAVVCGLLEQDAGDYYNIAAVIGDGWVEQYRQKYPAVAPGNALKLKRGDYCKIMLPSQWSMGLMVCNDYNSAPEFFAEYKDRGVNAVILIADAMDHVWLRRFPECCRQYELPAIVCNAAGEFKGGSCVINSAGQFVSLNTRYGQRDQLPDTAMAATGVLIL